MVAPDDGDGLPQGSVLIVEEHSDTLRLMCRLLRMHGYAVHEATSCAQALDVVRREGCRIVVSDVNLPDCSGLALMRTLRERGDRVRGLAVTGHAGEDHADAARDAGFECYMVKPVRVDDLLEHLRAMMA